MLAALRNRSYKQAVLRRLNGSEPTAQLPAGGQTQRCLIEALFVLMGRLAKLDGRVTRAEIIYANDVMQRLGLDDAARAHAIACFDLGKQRRCEVMRYLQLLVNRIGERSDLAREVLRVLCQLVQVKGEIQLREKILLRDIAETLGYDKTELLELCLVRREPKSSRSAHVSSVLRDAYSILQLECDAVDAEIRKAYLRLMSRYHPDKIRRTNLTPETLKFAQEQSMVIRAAYETVCGFRKIRA